MEKSPGTGVRQRRQQENEARRDKVEDIRRKMKEAESRQQRRETLTSFVRPILLVMTVIATLVFLYWWFVLRFSENDDKAKPLRVNIFEPNEMKESIIEEVDDTEHLYLEQ